MPEAGADEEDATVEKNNYDPATDDPPAAGVNERTAEEVEEENSM